MTQYDIYMEKARTMTYREFKDNIKNNIHIPAYYDLLLLHSEAIVYDVSENRQQTVAAELGLSGTQFSYIYRLLKAHNRKTISDRLE